MKTNVNQYTILHDTSITRCESHSPEGEDESGGLEAKSNGTRRMALAGRARARKTGNVT